MENKAWRLVAGEVHLSIDLRAYRLNAVKKTAYRLADRCTAVLGAPDVDALPVTFLFKSGVSEDAAREVVRAFFEELLDQELREEIGEETGPLRALLIANAFSKTDLIDKG
jgi:His-Xaa-Ser system protein HxsD